MYHNTQSNSSKSASVPNLESCITAAIPELLARTSAYKDHAAYDELFQAAVIGFSKGLQTFSEHSEVTMSEYAFSCAIQQFELEISILSLPER